MWSAPDIVNAAIAAGGLLVSVIGIIAIFVQVRKARGAAEAASDATRRTREEVAQRVTEADLGTVTSELRSLQDRLRADQREAALRSCQDIRQRFAALRARPVPGVPQERWELLAWAMATLTRIREALEQPRDAAESALDIASTNSEVEKMIDIVVEWQQSSLFLETGSDGHD